MTKVPGFLSLVPSTRNRQEPHQYREVPGVPGVPGYAHVCACTNVFHAHVHIICSHTRISTRNTRNTRNLIAAMLDSEVPGTRNQKI